MIAPLSPVAVGLGIFGLFFLIGFFPVGIVLLLIAAAVQSSHRRRFLAQQHGRRHSAINQNQRERDSAVRSFDR